MSTKAIRDFLEWYSKAMPSDAPDAPPGGKKARAALREVEAIERMAKRINGAVVIFPPLRSGETYASAADAVSLVESIAKDAP